jgi:hypothetical protein
VTEGGRAPASGAVHWLTAQAVVFGVVAAVLGVVANAMFLDAYGPTWLPLTYVLIGVAGAALSAAVAASASRFDLVRIAVVVLGGAAVVFLAAWGIAAGRGGTWVSGPLLVLFPLLIQLGFVFLGAQAGRVLDIAGIKARFPRILAGFPVGAVLGSLLAARLVAVFGSTDVLLLTTALAQALFALLVLLTGVRYSALLAVAPPARPADDGRTRVKDAGPTLRGLLTSPFVALILGYQVLSALASQLSDYLVYDRAAAQYPAADDLARFLAGYTAVMNVVSIAFLVFLAGPLMRRFGLRAGIAANPVVLTAGALAMVLVLALTGAASFALLVTVSVARILDIALTDGTTRTSINAMYQVLPERTRLQAQTTIEGMGVPVAIAVSGVVVMGLNLLPSPLAALVGTTVLVCLAWVWVGVLVYRAYGPALVAALPGHRVLAPVGDLLTGPQADRAIGELVSSADPRSTRLGLELVGVGGAAVSPEVRFLADDPRVEVRLAALGALVASGDGRWNAGRCALLDRLLDDPSEASRSAALDAVAPGDDAFVVAAVAALDDRQTAVAARGALRRLGDAAMPALDRALGPVPAGSPGARTARSSERLLRSVGTGTDASRALLLRWVAHPDRALGRVALERLASRATSPDAAPQLDAVLTDDLAHAVRTLVVIVALGASSPGDEPLRGALADELVLVRDRSLLALVARHGRERLGPVVAGILAGDDSRPLALEALEVALGPPEAARLSPVVDHRDVPEVRLRRLLAATGARPADHGVDTLLADLVEDPGGEWRSPWVRACALRAAAGRELVPSLDLRSAAAQTDRVVDEELARLP